MKMTIVDRDGAKYKRAVRAKEGYTWVLILNNDVFLWYEVPIRLRPIVPKGAELNLDVIDKKSKENRE